MTRTALWGILLSSGLLGACQSDDEQRAQQTSSTGIPLPRAASGLPNSSLSPTLTVNGNTVTAQVINGKWVASFPVPTGTPFTLNIDWLHTPSQTKVAAYSQMHTVTTNTALALDDSDYSTAFDDDDDGHSNIEEIRFQSSPTSDQSTPLAKRVVIPRINASLSPNINGVGDDDGWAQAVTTDQLGNKLLIENLIVNNAGSPFNSTAYHNWRAMHDGERLYFLIEQTDSVHRRDSANSWDDDNINLMFDIGYDRSTSYETGDAHVMFPFFASGTQANNGVEAFFGLHSKIPTNTLTAMNWATAYDTTTVAGTNLNRNVYEIAIELSALNLSPGDLFGLDVCEDDDDNGGQRDAKRAWANARVANQSQTDNDLSFKNPQHMGAALLAP